MFNSLYSAAAGMDAAMQRHDVSSQNLAHIQMPGYRRLIVGQQAFGDAFASASQSAEPLPAGGGPSGQPGQSAHLLTDFTEGPLLTTGGKLDVALQGQGFFVVNGPSGDLYTRNGAFQVDSDGTLVTMDGLPVQGDGGPIKIPESTSLNRISITPEGAVTAGGVEFGKLEVVTFDDPQKLERAGVTLFKAPEDVEPKEADGVRVAQGVREGSNSYAIEELVSLIAASRHYEAAQKAMHTIDDAAKRHMNLPGGA